MIWLFIPHSDRDPLMEIHASTRPNAIRAAAIEVGVPKFIIPKSYRIVPITKVKKVFDGMTLEEKK